MFPEACTLPAEVSAQLYACAREAQPSEACALLFGTPSEILRARPCANVSRQPDTAFRIDPVEQLACEEEARNQGVQVIGVWHSHPAGAPTPSESDRKAAWPGYLYLISGRDAQGEWQLRAFEREREAFRAVALRASGRSPSSGTWMDQPRRAMAALRAHMWEPLRWNFARRLASWLTSSKAARASEPRFSDRSARPRR